MPRVNVGDRVGAVMSATGTELLRLYGFGTYLGQKRPSEIPAEPVGPIGEAIVEQDRENPVIELDDGNYVWGCECWWGAEAVVKGQLDRYRNVENVSIEDARKQYRKR